MKVFSRISKRITGIQVKNRPLKCQNFDIRADYNASVRNYIDSIEENKKINRFRKLKNSYFYRELQNGEKIKHEWVLYSSSQGKIFCFFCKLFNELDAPFNTTGFNDWKYGLKSISDHENSFKHRRNLYTYNKRTKEVERIDNELQLQLNAERSYWIEILRRVVFIPCGAHSLNLVGVQTAESTEKVSRYFAFVQNLYTFFSASTRLHNRWTVLIRALAALGPKQKVVKKVSNTRWSARADAVFALNDGYKPIKTALESLITAESESEKTKNQAIALKKNMERLETVSLIFFGTMY